jgi:DNA-directed RNA polymerase beta subunit
VRTGPSHAVGAYPSNPEKLQDLSQPHIDSFNYFLDQAIHTAVKDIPKQEMKVADTGSTLQWWVESINIGHPSKNENKSSSNKLTPRECRERGEHACVLGAQVTNFPRGFH